MTVVLEHMFHPSEMEEEATLREDLEDDIKTECTKMGPVEKVCQPHQPVLNLAMHMSTSACVICVHVCPCGCTTLGKCTMLFLRAMLCSAALSDCSSNLLPV